MTVRWGVLGAGWIVRTATAAAFHDADGAVLQAIGARDRARAEALGPRIAYDSYAAVIEDPDVDAVYIALSNDAHLPWIVAALEAGKHVLCEKPLTLSHDQAVEAFALAEHRGLLLVEAAWSRWHPRMQRLSELVASAGVGTVHEYEGSFTFSGVPQGNYRLEPKRGGGALLDVGVYPLHGLVATIPDPSALAVIDVVHERHRGGVDLTTSADLQWGPGTRARITASFIQPEHQQLALAGSEGRIDLPGNDAFTSWRAPSTLVVNGHLEEFAPVDAYRIMVEQVSTVILGGTGWVVPPRDSLAVAHLLDMLRTEG